MAAAAQNGLQALAQELLQLQQQLCSLTTARASAAGAQDKAVAVDAAVTALQEEVADMRAQLQQACSREAAEEHQLQLFAKVQALEQQLQQMASDAAASPAVPVAEPAGANVDALAALRKEVSHIKKQVLAAAAAESAAAPAVASLQAEVRALQDQLAWSSSSAAAAASAAATDAVEEVKEQLEDLQGQVVRSVALSRSATGAAGPMQAAATAAGADAEMPAARQPLVCRSGLSFNDLAVAPSTSSRALVQQLFTNVASETAPTAEGAGHADATAGPADANSWFNPMFEAAPTAADAQQQELPQRGPAEESFGSLVGGAQAAGAAGAEEASSQQLLGGQLALLSPAHQVEFLGKLARVVSSHAARLLATYREDAALAGQLQQVQERLSAFMSTSASAASAVSRAVRTSDASSARLNVSSSISRRSVSALPAGADAAGSAAPGFAAGEVLLGILDQVAALRAIGSATHPAISQALHQQAAQIAELMDKQQQLQQALQAARAGCSEAAGAGSSSAAQEDKAGDTAVAPTAVTAASAEVASSGSAAGGVEQYEGEYGQRLAALESRLGSGLQVLAGLRDRLAPLQEVADASQCMMRELQVAHGLVLQRLEALEGLAAAGMGQAEGGGEGQDAAAAGGALAVAGSFRKLQVRC
jgi:hypothetical protein